jgi:hypothetical protein
MKVDKENWENEYSEGSFGWRISARLLSIPTVVEELTMCILTRTSQV